MPPRSNGPDRIIRASRHYEKAGQILTRQAVATAKQFINGKKCDPPAIGQVVTAMAPARVDLAGGWSDTPPIAYEFGGTVVTLALKLNNEVSLFCKLLSIACVNDAIMLFYVQYPIKATAERLAE